MCSSAILLYPENVFFFNYWKGFRDKPEFNKITLHCNASHDTKKQLDWCILPLSAVIEKQALNEEGKILEKKRGATTKTKEQVQQ